MYSFNLFLNKHYKNEKIFIANFDVNLCRHNHSNSAAKCHSIMELQQQDAPKRQCGVAI